MLARPGSVGVLGNRRCTVLCVCDGPGRSEMGPEGAPQRRVPVAIAGVIRWGTVCPLSGVWEGSSRGSAMVECRARALPGAGGE